VRDLTFTIFAFVFPRFAKQLLQKQSSRKNSLHNESTMWLRDTDHEISPMRQKKYCCYVIFLSTFLSPKEVWEWAFIYLRKIRLLGSHALRTKNIHCVLCFRVFTILERGSFIIISAFGLLDFWTFGSRGLRTKNIHSVLRFGPLTWVFGTKNIHCSWHVYLSSHSRVVCVRQYCLSLECKYV